MNQPPNASSALGAAAELYQTLFEQAADGIFLTDIGGRFLEVNQRGCEMLGYTHAELLSLSIADIAPDGGFMHVTDLPRGLSMTAERSLLRKDGCWLPVEISGRKLSDGNLLGLVRDRTERQQAEARHEADRTALRASEAKYRALFENMISGFALHEMIYDEHGQPVDYRFLDVNPAFEQLTTWPASALIGKTVREVMPDTEDYWIQTAGQVDRTGVPSVVDNYSRELGRYYSASFFRAQPGQVAVVFYDATERRVMEETLRESEAHYRGLFENMLNGFAYCQMVYEDDRPVDFIYLSVNKAFGELTGLRDVIGKRVTEVIPGVQEATPELFEMYGRVAMTGQPEWFEINFTPLQRWLSISAYSPATGYFVAIFENVTERKLAEAALRDSEANLKASQRVAHVGHWVWDTATNQVTWSDEMYRIFGLSRDRVTGDLERIIQLAIHPDDREKVRQSNETVLREQRPAPMEYRVVWPDRSVHTLWAVPGDRVTAPDGAILKLTGIVQDITERKRAEQGLERRAAQLAILNDVGRQITSTLAVDQALELAARLIHQKFGYHHVAIFIYDQAARAQYLRARAGAHLDLYPLGYRLPESEGMVGWVTRHGRSLLANDVDAEPAYIHYPGAQILTRSELSVPIQLSGRVRGVLDIQSPQLNAFEANDVLVMETLAGQIAVALENAQLYEDVQRELAERAQAEVALRQSEIRYRHQARELSSLNRAGRALTSTLDLPKLLNLVIDEIKLLTQAQGVSVLLYDEAADELTFAAVVGPGAEQLVNTRMPASAGVAGWVLRERLPALVQDAQADPRFYGGIDHRTGLTTRSLMAVPVIHQDKFAGLFEAINKMTNEPFEEHDLILLEGLAASAAIAIENARLYQMEREQYQRLQQTQAQMIHVEKMAALGRLVASIAHEINNPLQAVQGCLGLGLEEITGRQRRDKLISYLQMAAGEIERIAQILARMRDFYRPSGEEMRPVDVHAILRSVLDLSQKQLQHSHVIVVCEWEKDLPPIVANPDHLKQVFLNLVLNAIDAMPETGGTLRLRTRPDRLTLADREVHAAVRLEFSDSGEGIPADVLPRIFEPFFTAKKGGSGLGLAISYGIIEAHNGLITATSRVNEGTTFAIVLPVEQP